MSGTAAAPNRPDRGSERDVSGAALLLAERPWLARYPQGVPAEIDVAEAGTVVDLFRVSVERYPERPAVESFGVRRNYGELARDAAAVASWLGRIGLARGDRVAIMLPNVMAYPAILFGALMAGASVVNVNPLYTPRELTGQLNDSGAKVLFVLENVAHTLQASLPAIDVRYQVIVAPGDLLGPKGALVNLVSRHVKRAVTPFRLPASITFGEVMRLGRLAPPARVAIAPEDVAFLQYTGGTTGTPKGAVLTHRNVAANVAQTEAWARPTLGSQAHIMVTALPLYHVFALTACCLLMVRLGGCQLLVANPRDLKGFVNTLRTRPFTCLSGVNTLYNALVHAPAIRSVDFSRLVFAVAGGMATQNSVARAWHALTGRPIVEGYGLSETSPVVAVNRLDLQDFTGTIGYPIPSTEVSIRDAEDRTVAIGGTGELCVRGPQVMRGYWNQPEETASVMTSDGFFRTGDVAVMEPDGAIRIVDRLKDMVLVSGFNVHPSEVEEVISAHPGVGEAAVVGEPSDTAGERAVAYVVRRDPALDEEALAAWCRERLAAYKVPRRIIFRRELPKTNVGKVLRRALRNTPAAD